MGKIIVFLVIAVVAALLTMIKQGIGKVTSNENLKNTSLKGETKKVINKTAKGLNWMDQQWEEAKQKIDDKHKEISNK